MGIKQVNGVKSEGENEGEKRVNGNEKGEKREKGEKGEKGEKTEKKMNGVKRGSVNGTKQVDFTNECDYRILCVQYVVFLF